MLRAELGIRERGTRVDRWILADRWFVILLFWKTKGVRVASSRVQDDRIRCGKMSVNPMLSFDHVGAVRHVRTHLRKVDAIEYLRQGERVSLWLLFVSVDVTHLPAFAMHHEHHALTLVARHDDRPELGSYLFTLVFFEVNGHETVVVAQAETFDAGLNSQGAVRSKASRKWIIVTFVEAVRGSNAQSLTQPLSSNPMVMITSVVKSETSHE